MNSWMIWAVGDSVCQDWLEQWMQTDQFVCFGFGLAQATLAGCSCQDGFCFWEERMGWWSRAIIRDLSCSPDDHIFSIQTPCCVHFVNYDDHPRCSDFNQKWYDNDHPQSSPVRNGVDGQLWETSGICNLCCPSPHNTSLRSASTSITLTGGDADDEELADLDGSVYACPGEVWTDSRPQSLATTPTAHMMNANVNGHIISCPEDGSMCVMTIIFLFFSFLFLFDKFPHLCQNSMERHEGGSIYAWSCIFSSLALQLFLSSIESIKSHFSSVSQSKCLGDCVWITS